MSDKKELAEVVAKGFAGLVGAIEQLRAAVVESSKSVRYDINSHEQRLSELERKGAQ